MRTAKRVLTVAAVSFPMLLGATAVAMADGSHDGSPTQEQNQDEVQVSKPTNTNVSPSTVVQIGGHKQVANTGSSQTNNADQDQDGDWDGNAQAQLVKDGGSPTQVQNQNEIQVSKPTNTNVSPSTVVQIGGKEQIANTGSNQTNNANQTQAGDWQDNTQAQLVRKH
ncbi:hypothetical protein [Saccharopolyspora spinosa]|uniref:Uncharacterized protein n=1 Tax=Saccharopolyspora spinosa TaxID=60894 RepID=A0A2N3XUA0_SACSN|nr:hypothetical protein [Saccharopolyspora spinosa]PKW14257.1 hypothetical protein A8926_1859 [Saccharopolyspora spinosa]